MTSQDKKIKKSKSSKREAECETSEHKAKKSKIKSEHNAKKSKIKSEPKDKKNAKAKLNNLQSKESKPDVKIKKEASIVKQEEVDEKMQKRQARQQAKLEKERLEEEITWKWWEDPQLGEEDGEKKWTTLQHNGPYFAPKYEPLPKEIKFFYDGKPFKLNALAEEAAVFYSQFIEHEYTTKEVFRQNFFTDFKNLLSNEESKTIKTLEKCDFSKIFNHSQEKKELRKTWTTEQKNELKEKNKAIDDECGYCLIDGHRQKIGNFKVEPPGLFRGRGEHPKMGQIKKRIVPEQVIINCSPESIPQPPEGHKWKEVRHCNTVSWLAMWQENIQGQHKYVMLNAASKFKSQKDFQKYENARKLHNIVDTIRSNYRAGMKSDDVLEQQRSVAMYFIDRLALRAGNEKDEDEADTVGCCSLRVEHIKLHKTLPENPESGPAVEFDFLGKDSIRYYNVVQIPKIVYVCLMSFVANKKGDNDLFDRLSTSSLNKYLTSIMPGLTAKVFRTYNASITLEQELVKESNKNKTVEEKLLSYNRANKSVAILCNHQRAVPKTHEASMQRLDLKIETKKEQIKELKKSLKETKDQKTIERFKKKLDTFKQQLKKLEIQKLAKDENKQIALGTSKLNYLDPRITISWCLKQNVPIEKVFNKTQRDKFNWAISMTERGYKFADLPEKNEDE